ncbi:MAG: pentapeptide repeat-containing protein [Coleofasciculaceae cyanobacterium RL_1_1]|nr:pentapeptide repeat-containing protein [Coleofasciculaceae cyanobacterium RL_1_1]
MTARVISLALATIVFLSGFYAGFVGNLAPALADNYEKATLFDQDLSSKDLSDSNFTLATLRKCDLHGATLVGLRLFRAKFLEVDLHGADLRYATLDSALFSDSNLNDANLEGAFAYHTRFEGTTIDGADFTDVLLRDDALDVLCNIATGTNPMTGRNTRDTLMCDYR